MERYFHLLVVVSLLCSAGAKYETPNFVVTASSEEIARQVATRAEALRKEIAQEWLEKELADWSEPCQIHVKGLHFLPSGHTSFVFDDGEVYDWDMRLQGSLHAILESVLPHEISHVVMASYFRCPVPRWADEGVALSHEDKNEQHRQRVLMGEIVESSRTIPLRELISMTEYPKDHGRVMVLYAQSFSICEFLTAKSAVKRKDGKVQFLSFLKKARDRGWDRALQVYGYQRHETAQGDTISAMEQLESEWIQWVRSGYLFPDSKTTKHEVAYGDR